MQRADLAITREWLRTLVWRLAMRMMFVWRAYGPWQAALSVPRAFVANIIAIMAARAAMVIYVRHLRGGVLAWDKTRHRFPEPATGTAA